MDIPVFFTGLSMGLSLIVAIGAQNAFVLRLGLKAEHVFAVCLACALSDAVLMAFGVSGLAAVMVLAPWLGSVLRYGGAAFLIWYGAKSLWSAFRSKHALSPMASADRAPLLKTLAACLAVTWLNPHVYLDTVLLGSIAAQFPGRQVSFAVGVTTGSFLFFFSLGYGASWLRPIFATPAAWRMLEGLVAAVMAVIATKLLFGL